MGDGSLGREEGLGLERGDGYRHKCLEAIEQHVCVLELRLKYAKSNEVDKMDGQWAGCKTHGVGVEVVTALLVRYGV